MAFDKTDKNFVITAGILGILQGTAWTVLSLMAIIIYNSEPLNFQPESYMGYLQYVWYSYYLTFDTEVFVRTLKPSAFSGFMWVYFFLDLLWIFISLYIATKNKDERIQKSITAWSYLTLFISLWDLITVILLGADYSSCMQTGMPSDTNYKIAFEQVCAEVVLPLLMIAAKGFVLWILNIVIAVVLLNLVKRIKKGPLENPAFTGGYQIPHPSFGPPRNQYGQYPQASAPAPPNSQIYNREQNFVQYPPSPQSFIPSTPQNVNRNRFEYPSVPDPDYHRYDHTPGARKY